MVHRFLGENKLQTIEVKRVLGPFGNSKNSLFGRWGIKQTGITFRYQYMVDASGREVGMAAGRTAKTAAVVAHVASGAWRLPSFATNGDTRLFHKLRAVHQLTMRLSACEVLRAVGEDPEEEMSADADEALRGLVEHFHQRCTSHEVRPRH